MKKKSLAAELVSIFVVTHFNSADIISQFSHRENK